MLDVGSALRSMIFITDLKIDFFEILCIDIILLLLLVNIYTKNKFQSNLLYQ